MKRQITYAAAIGALIASAVLSINSCDTQNTTTPETSGFGPASDLHMTVGPESAAHEILYSIENPSPEKSVKATVTPDADWIYDVNETGSYGIVSFMTAENTDTTLTREAVITLTYGDEKLDFTITQETARTYGHFAIATGPNTTGEVFWTVTPPDDELTYVTMLTDKATWNSFSSYEEYMQYDIKYFQDMAEERGIPYEDFLKASILKKGKTEASVKDLSPDSEYVVYAYGMDSTGRILTGMYYAETSTMPVEDTDVTFELSVTQEFPYATISAVPSRDDVYYLMDIYNSTGTPEEITQAYQEMLDEVLYMVSAFGMSIYDYMMDTAFIGPATSDPIQVGEVMEFTAFAVAVDVNTGTLTSVASTQVCEIDFGF